MNNLEQILGDLFKLDPELKENEQEVRQIVEKLLAANPDPKLDQAFAHKLKKEIQEKIKSSSAQKKRQSRFFPSLATERFSFAFGGAALALLAAFVIAPAVNRPLDRPTGKDAGQNIVKVAQKAFGDIFFSEGMPNRPEAAEIAGLDGANMMAGKTEALSTEIGVADKALFMPYYPEYEYINYNYNYTGGEFNLEREMNVYRKIKQALPKKINIVDIFDTNLFNLKNLKNLEFEYVNINENREFGYSVNINYSDNSISLYPNWRKWPRLPYECYGKVCANNAPLTPADIPEDKTLIDLALKFAKEYGLNTNSYKEPLVLKNWESCSWQTETEAMIYVPEEMQVVFPLIIDRQTVSDWSGSPFGLYLSINIRQMKVATAGSFSYHNYESSGYPIENNYEKFVQLAEQGGIYPNYQHPNPAKTINITLGAPAMSLIPHHKYNPEKNEADELYVPALIFPITDVSEPNHYCQKNIIIPLVAGVGDDFRIIPYPAFDSEAVSPEIEQIRADEPIKLEEKYLKE